MGNKANTASEELKAGRSRVLLARSELLDSALPETRRSPVSPVPQANVCILFVADAPGAPSQLPLTHLQGQLPPWQTAPECSSPSPSHTGVSQHQLQNSLEKCQGFDATRAHPQLMGYRSQRINTQASQSPGGIVLRCVCVWGGSKPVLDYSQGPGPLGRGRGPAGPGAGSCGAGGGAQLGRGRGERGQRGRWRSAPPRQQPAAGV